MRIVVNTILNSLIKEFIKLIANYSKGYKKLINSSLSITGDIERASSFKVLAVSKIPF